MATNKTQQTPAEVTATKTEAFVLRYKKIIATSVVAVIAVVAAIILFNTLYLTPRQAEASTALAKGQDYFAQEQFEKALNGDGAGYIGFLKVIDQYGCTDAANLAHLYAGLSYAQLGKWDEAAAQLDDYSTADDALVSPAAVAALGNVYVNLGKVDEAVSCLKKAAKMADKRAKNGHNLTLAPQFLLQAGILLENQKKSDDALDVYQDIKKNYVGSPIYREIDKYIERVTK